MGKYSAYCRKLVVFMLSSFLLGGWALHLGVEEGGFFIFVGIFLLVIWAMMPDYERYKRPPHKENTHRR